MSPTFPLPSFFHALETSAPLPEAMPDPFSGAVHPLCRAAAEEVKAYIGRASEEMRRDAQSGKMFGVLVVEKEGCVGFLAAYSGLLAAHNDWPWFVPPVFDAQQPDGHFKRREREISQLNRQIADLEQSGEYAAALQSWKEAQAANAAEEESFRQKMRQAKQLRDIRRLHHNLPPEEEAQLIQESQFLKAELHRMKKRHEQLMAEKQQRAEEMGNRLETLKARRREWSDDLQHWLFAQYHLLNGEGQVEDLTAVFDRYRREQHSLATGLPPSGSGDCCAPKLLQCAFANAMRPLCMAEFWWGQSPKGEIRHHNQFYPPCQGKCRPILAWMLRGIKMEDPAPPTPTPPLQVIHEDEWMAVVAKPAGMLSVPGRTCRHSVEEVMRTRWHNRTNPLIVHRLDMETSGLMVVARTKYAHEVLQRQFLEHQVTKQYVAVLDGVPQGRPSQGTISLPLCPDDNDRPRQMVDTIHGKEAITRYEIVNAEGPTARVNLFPLTGRTHQLRLHCAHPQGLGVPIVGDALYGHGGPRLMLHAAQLSFLHPHTLQPVSFTLPPPF